MSTLPARQTILSPFWSLDGNWNEISDVTDVITLDPGASGIVSFEFALPRITVPGQGSRLRDVKVHYSVTGGGLLSISPSLHEFINCGTNPRIDQVLVTTSSSFGVVAGQDYLGRVHLESPFFDTSMDCEFYSLQLLFTSGNVGASIQIECVEALYDFAVNNYSISMC